VEQADVVVVGAGLGGAATAFWLSRLGAGRVRILEQGSASGAEASAQNAGMLRRLAVSPVERALACRSARWLCEPPGEAWAEAPCYRRTGGLIALAAPPEGQDAHGPAGLAAAAVDLRARGLRVEEPALDMVARIAPALAGAALHRAWYLPEEGLLDAHAVVQGCLAEARRAGARLDLGVRVEELVVEGGAVVGLESSAGPIRTGCVVLATGAWSAGLAAQAGLDRPLVPLARHLLQSDPHALSHLEHPYVWLEDQGLYARPEAGGWLVSPCDEHRVPLPRGPGSRGPVAPLWRAVASDKLGRLLPALGALRLPRGWTGLRTFSPDRGPVLGADPELAGLHWCAGLGGFGLSTSMAVGEAVATWLCGGQTPWLAPAEQAAAAPGRRVAVDRLPAPERAAQ